MDQITEELFKSIHLITETKLSETPYLMGISGKIIKRIDKNGDPTNEYEVFFQGVNQRAFSVNDRTYNSGDIVYVIVNNANPSDKKLIVSLFDKVGEFLSGGTGGGQTITLTGDVSGQGVSTIETTLSNTGVTPGTYGSQSSVPVLTIDSKGRVTSVSTEGINALPAGGLTGQILAKASDTAGDVEWIDNFTPQVKHLVKAAENILVGQAVYVSSANGTNMIVSKASNSIESTSSKTMGLLQNTLNTNEFGYVITEGLLDGLDTSMAQAGDPVWLGENGNLLYGLANKPVAPNHLVFIGIVTRAQQNNGEIFVKVQNGFELNEIHDVLITNKLNKDLLSYDSVSGLWKNKTFESLDIPTKTYVDSNKQPINSLLSAFTTLTENGFLVRTGSGGAATRSILVSGSGVSISNQDGVAGNPEITINSTSTNTPSTIIYRDSSGNFSANIISAELNGNAATVTNGVYTTGSYLNPSWITQLSGSKVSGNISGSSANVTGIVAIQNGGTGASTAYGAQENLGLLVGTNVQGYSLELESIAGINTASGLLKKVSSGNWILDTSVYLTEEADTLATVTGRGATSSSNITLSSTSDAVSSTDGGALTISGGLAIAKKVYTGSDLNVGGNLVIAGNFTVSGTTTTINTESLSVEDNMIYLNAGSNTANPDLGIAANYNDGTYRHTGLFRDATDGIWKFFHQYTPEPDASVFIDTTHASFALAPISFSNATATGVITAPIAKINTGFVVPVGLDKYAT